MAKDYVLNTRFGDDAPTDLTDSSGGTAASTVAAVSGSGADTDINNNFATLTAAIAALNARLRK
jgi:hypothetical protein